MFGFNGGFGGGYGGGYSGISNQPFYGSYPSFNQGFGGNRGTSLEGIASLVNMFAQMSPEQFDTGIARLAQFKDVYGSGNFGGMGGNNFSGQSLFSSSPSGMSNFRQPSGLGMPFGNSIRQGSVNSPSFSSPAPNPLFSNASLTGAGVTMALQGPGGVATGGQSQLGQLSPDFLQKSQEREQRIANRIANAVPAGFVADSVLNPPVPGQAVGQAIKTAEGYTNPQTGEKIFISTYGDNVGDITHRIAAPEGYQPQEMPSPFQGLAKLRR